MLYGARGDPYAALSVLGRRLAATTDPRQVLDALAQAAAETVLSPYVVAEAAGGLLRVERGTPQQVAISIPLTFQGAALGWLRLAARSPGEPFDPRDRQLLDDTAAHAGAAVCAAVTELDLRSARERLVTSREEERRQLRRDLHDGIGPVLAGLGFTAEAAARALPADPVRAAQLLSSVHQQVSTAIAAVRQISRELRPAPLAELGLAGAIRRLAEPAVEAGIDLTVSLPDGMPELPAATEVAAYHIAAEAITNALRHSQATRLTVELSRVPGQLVLRISDDGTGYRWNIVRGLGWPQCGSGLRSSAVPGRCTRPASTAPPWKLACRCRREPDAHPCADRGRPSRRAQRPAGLAGREQRLRAGREAEDGIAALAAIRQTRPDVVLMDLTMPKMSGWRPPGGSRPRPRPPGLPSSC